MHMVLGDGLCYSAFVCFMLVYVLSGGLLLAKPHSWQFLSDLSVTFQSPFNLVLPTHHHYSCIKLL